MGRPPSRSFTFLSLIFFVLAGALLSTTLLSRFPEIARKTALRYISNPDRKVTVVAESFCTESNTPLIQFYALLAQSHRHVASSLVFGGSALSVRQGTVMHEYGRAGRLSRVGGSSSGKTCWIPTVMLGDPTSDANRLP